MSELERALLALGHELEVPRAPDVVPAVLERIEPRGRRGWGQGWGQGWGHGRQRLAIAVAVVLLAALAAVLAVPDARSALFRVLHIGGQQVELVDELPPVDGGLDESTLGERVTLDEARRRAGAPLRELDEPPDRVYVLGTRPTVWFVHGAPGEVRLLVSQSPGLVVDRELIVKKLVSPESSLVETDVHGAPAFFIGGSPHVVLLVDERGSPVEETTRLAGNVLFWQEGDVAYRLEGDFSQDEAVALAESLR
jgi:hypothetical protein